MTARASYDPEADAIGVYFAPDGAEYAESREVAPGVTLDFDASGAVIGVELLGVRELLAERRLPPRAEGQRQEQGRAAALPPT